MSVVDTRTSALIERVQLERKLRSLSVRQASQLGGTSNTTWSRYEAEGVVTDNIRAAIASAFNWPTDWPENPPAPPVHQADDLARLLELAEMQVAHLVELTTRVSELGAEVARLGAQVRRAGGGSP